MVLSDERKRAYLKRILLARLRILCQNGFYGMLLMHANMRLTDSVEMAGMGYENDGSDFIGINPEFLDAINDDELDFILMHEIMHIALQHGPRSKGFEPERFNIAADIVVNANIYESFGRDIKKITLQGNPAPYLAPNGNLGSMYSVEELYGMIPKPAGNPTKGPGSEEDDNSNQSDNSSDSEAGEGANGSGFDNHFFNDGGKGKKAKKQEMKWKKQLADIVESMKEREQILDRELVPKGAERLLGEFTQAQLDWRQLLHDFISEEICDYSFSPPDRRFDDNPFFLPDFNDTEVVVKDILFMIDASASMSTKQITEVYCEILGALEQYNGKLKGWLGFFDAKVTEPEEFTTEDEFKIIRPKGGGGTDFGIIFAYVRDNMSDQKPASIIILTDGYAPFPDYEVTMDIPVLWVINNDVVTPPWGKICRLKSK